MNEIHPFKSQVIVRNQFPKGKWDPQDCFLIYDQVFEKGGEEFESALEFIESFPHRLAVKAGESLKDFHAFPKMVDRVLKKWPQPVKRSQHLIALGGGSIGDFAGFLASILKRGVPLVHLPSTWLSAIDSAHGGKTALNYRGVKNQLGSFYPAQKVFVIRDLLEAGDLELKTQAYGELVKMALIGESQFFKEILVEKREPSDFIWRFMKMAIEDKYVVVLQDPYERKKVRNILNFGHSFGHALEAHFGWSHGESVMQGMFFALEWSRYRGDLSQRLFEEIMECMSQKFDRGPAHKMNWYRAPRKKAMAQYLLADKKINASGQLNFVFLKSIGRPMVKPVKVEDLLSEAKRQHWVK